MTSIIGIPLYDKGLLCAVQDIKDICVPGVQKLNRCVSATGAHGLVYAQNNPSFAAMLKFFYMNLPDGMPGVWVGRLKGAHTMDRCYGPDFFCDVMRTTNSTSVKHYLCGGKEGVADQLKLACKEKFHNNNIVGTYCPPFRDLTDNEFKTLADDIDQNCADIVWIGISTPKQEIFADKLSQYTNVHFIVTVGAAFDFHIGNVRQAPKLIQKLGLEWLFRLCMEPKRLYKRYFEIVPMFIYYNLREFTHTLVSKGVSQK